MFTNPNLALKTDLKSEKLFALAAFRSCLLDVSYDYM